MAIYKPQTNNANSANEQQPPAAAMPGDIILASLETMPKDELRTLLQRICAARWGEVALLTEEEAYEAICLRLLHGGLSEKDLSAALPSLKEWMDRRKGKPAQVIHQNNVNTVNVLVNRVRDDLRELDTDTIIEMKRLLERGSQVVENDADSARE